MMQKLLNIIYLIVLVVCVCLIIRVFNAQPASVSAVTASNANGATAIEIPRIEVSASETKKFAADKFEMGFSLEIRGKDKEAVSKRLAERRSVIFEQHRHSQGMDLPQQQTRTRRLRGHAEFCDYGEPKD